ncbi:MAG: hypothetical protein LBR94_01195, partial [Desulfovibrio sp.]|nr:hypothetical protein [Desulfovibrio sp.]
MDKKWAWATTHAKYLGGSREREAARAGTAAVFSCMAAALGLTVYFLLFQGQGIQTSSRAVKENSHEDCFGHCGGDACFGLRGHGLRG